MSTRLDTASDNIALSLALEVLNRHLAAHPSARLIYGARGYSVHHPQVAKKEERE